MSQPESSTKIDPELLRQLNETATSEQPIEVVARLRPDKPSEIVLPPERIEELTKQVLSRVKEQVGSSEDRYHVFKNLGSFVISANPAFIRELISQPEVAAVMANYQPDSMAIAPVKIAPVPTAKPRKAPRSAKKAKASSSARDTAASRKHPK